MLGMISKIVLIESFSSYIYVKIFCSLLAMYVRQEDECIIRKMCCSVILIFSINSFSAKWSTNCC